MMDYYTLIYFHSVPLQAKTKEKKKKKKGVTIANRKKKKHKCSGITSQVHLI
jgi:hypothetical protein